MIHIHIDADVHPNHEADIRDEVVKILELVLDNSWSTLTTVITSEVN